MEILYDCYTPYFTQIALNSLIKERDLRDDLREIKHSLHKNYDELYRIHQIWLEHFFVTIVFSSFAVESYINGYCVRRLSSSYFKNYIEKLSVESKWIVGPQLATTKTICGTHAHELLLKLIKARNRLAHDKPKHKRIDTHENPDTAIRYIKSGQDIAIEISALDAVRALVELNKELLAIDPDTEIFPLIDNKFLDKWNILSKE